MPISGGGGGSGKGDASAIKAGEAFVSINADDSQFTSAIKRIANRFHGLGQSLRNVGLGTAAIGTAITAPLIGTFEKLIEKGDKIQDVVEKTDASAEAISRLAHAGKFANIDLEDLVLVSKNLTKSTIAASKGAKDQATAFDLMRISAEDFAKLDLDEKILMIGDTLEELQDPLQKDRFLLSTLGKSGQQFKQLFADGMDDVRKKFGEAGIISGKDAKLSADLMDELTRVWGAFKSTILSVGLALFGFSGEMKTGADIIVNTLAQVKGFIKQNLALIQTIFLVGGALVIGGTALALFGTAITGILVAIKTLIAVGTAVISTVFSPLAISIAAVVATGTGLYLLLRNILGLLTGFDGAGQVAINTFTEMGSTFQTMWTGIIATLTKGDFTAALEILKVGALTAFLQMQLGVTQAWNMFKKSFLDGWRDIGTSIRLIFTDIGLGIVKVLTNFLTTTIRGAQILASKLEQHGLADRLARAEESIQGIGDIFVADIEAEHKKIMDQRKRQQDESDKFRAGEEQTIRDQIAGLSGLLAGLVQRATQQPPAEPEKVKPKRNEDIAIRKLADASQGLFFSRDYRGALGLGPASDELKEQGKTQKDMLKELKDLNKKPGLIFD